MYGIRPPLYGSRGLAALPYTPHLDWTKRRSIEYKRNSTIPIPLIAFTTLTFLMTKARHAPQSRRQFIFARKKSFSPHPRISDAADKLGIEISEHEQIVIESPP
jgi:hypothetical protein